MEMTHRIFLVSFLIESLFVGAVGGDTTMTFLAGTDSSLPCESDNPINNEIFQWSEETSPPVVIYNVENGVATKITTDQKYTNFNTDVSSYPSSVPLIIEDVLPENEGTYQCTQVRAGETIIYNVVVEAVPISVNVSCTRNQANCPQTVGTSDEFICSCEAVGAYPDTLVLSWSNVEDNPATNPPTSSNERPGAYDYTGTAIFIPTETKKIATCTVGGYIGSWNVEEDDYPTAPPVCQVETFCSGTMTVVTLFCNCGGAIPSDGLSYSFFQNDVLIPSGDSKNSIEVPIEPDTEYVFGCRQCNGVNYGQESYSTADVICSDAGPTTDPITTTELVSTKRDNNINDTPGINTGLIAACLIVAAIFVVALVFVIIILIRRHQIGIGKEQNKSCTKEVEATNGGTDSNAYMDLQEMGNRKSRDTDAPQIPERNVKLLSILPGNGLLQYHKALITRANGNQEGVVRTLSDNSTVAASRILRSEVQENLRLGNDNNIVQLLGWCDTVPTFAIFELLRGRNLSNHLKEEFSPHSVHTYGNTKKKSFQVSEKGNIDVLPKYALQVASGMQFLTKNKFLHPGLRAKKVLLDTTGNCKLYDFVSLENAKEWTRLTWNESVPYQWMPPEFLFLEAISSAGDIWSFGVLLWEIFSYGSEPYIGQTRSDVERKIRQKELLRMPNNCPGAIWQLMLSCWQSSAEERPPIDNITARLTPMCHQDKEYQEIR